jgi:hypothetical protein
MAKKKPKCPDCKADGEGGGLLLKAYVFRPKPTFMSARKKEIIGYYCEECGSFFSDSEVE